MSTTATRRTFSEARSMAHALWAHFDGLTERTVIAGSVRRERPECGDVEIVCIPKFHDEPIPGTGDLFGGSPEVNRVNRLWAKMDAMVSAGALAKAVYPDGSHRWGDKYRGVTDRWGVRYEIFIADEANFGAILAIRTGPWELSKHLVTILKQGGLYVMEGGYVRYAGGPSKGEVRACPSEEDFFALCGMPYLPPNKRDAFKPEPRR